jgi:hypothetical protein
MGRALCQGDVVGTMEARKPSQDDDELAGRLGRWKMEDGRWEMGEGRWEKEDGS